MAARWSKLFFGVSAPLRGAEIAAIAREGLPGVGLAIALGLIALFIGERVKQFDPLVAAVVLGMAVRTALARHQSLVFRVLPGILLAQAVFIPLGIILYGKNVDLRALTQTHPLVAIQTMLLAITTMTLLYTLGRAIGVRDRFGILLGFGSAVCGASAIAITAPVCECEPDETAAGLVTNTVVVLVALAGFDMFLKHSLPATNYAAMSGELLHQTGAVKMALEDMGTEVLRFGLAVKSLRVAMLLVLIPAVSLVVRRELFFPWYLVLFAAVGVFFSFVTVSSSTLHLVGTVHNLCFCAALASVGLNANLRTVFTRLPKPLALVLGVFLIDAGIFLATQSFFVR